MIQLSPSELNIAALGTGRKYGCYSEEIIKVITGAVSANIEENVPISCVFKDNLFVIPEIGNFAAIDVIANDKVKFYRSCICSV